jgi:hypothetical protein
MTLWSIATPLGASPDEPANIQRAVAVAHGELLGAPVPGNANDTRFQVPSTYAQLAQVPTCFTSRPTVTAACIPRIRQSSRPVTVTNDVGRYPPLYYLTVGIPSLFTDHLLGVHLMRLLSALLGAAFVALAVATARRWSTAPLLPAAVMIAATPTSLFLAATVNPDGLEIACAIAVWTAAVVLVTEHAQAPPRALVAVLASSTAVLVLLRGNSPLWLGVVALVLGPMWLGRLRLRLLRRRRVQVSFAGAGLAVAAALTWTFTAHAWQLVAAPVPAGHTAWDGVSKIFGLLPDLFSAQIGLFGAAGTTAPWITTTLWYLLIGAAIAIAVMVGRTRQLLTLGLAVATTVAVPLVFAAATYGHDGAIEQGRDFLPIAVGIPIVALGCVRAQGRTAASARRLQTCFGTAVAIGQFFAFYFALRRYRVGVDGPIFGNGSLHASELWSPPLGTVTVEVLFLAACVAIVFAVRSSADPPPMPIAPSPELVTTSASP